MTDPKTMLKIKLKHSFWFCSFSAISVNPFPCCLLLERLYYKFQTSRLSHLSVQLYYLRRKVIEKQYSGVYKVPTGIWTFSHVSFVKGLQFFTKSVQILQNELLLFLEKLRFSNVNDVSSCITPIQSKIILGCLVSVNEFFQGRCLLFSLGVNRVFWIRDKKTSHRYLSNA